MSDEPTHRPRPVRTAQAASAAPATPRASGDSWGDPISDERKCELRTILASWATLSEEERAQWQGPFDRRRGIPGLILTGADVFWLAARALAESDGNGTGDDAIAEAEQQLRQAKMSGDGPPHLAITLDTLSLDALQLNYAHLREAHLEGAILVDAHFERADRRGSHLQDADLVNAHLEGAFLARSHLEYANLSAAHLDRAILATAHLNQAILRDAHLRQAYLVRADLNDAHLEDADLGGAQLREAHAQSAHFEGAHLVGAVLVASELQHAALHGAHLEGANLGHARLDGADLTAVVLDGATRLNDATLTGALMADVRWGGANLTVVDWQLVPQLGDEHRAWTWRTKKIRAVSRDERAQRRTIQERQRLGGFKAAVRANQQLAVALEDQGMADEAANYAERAQRLQRHVFGLQGQRWRAAWSRFLDVLAGYGYRPGRTVFWYLASVAVFGLLYFLASRGLITFGLKPSQFTKLPWYEALVLSVSSFHGRGFFQPVQSLGDPVAILAALEAVVGLLIEVSFIATFTQRFFGSR